MSESEQPARKSPIIVITGTPGTGKSTHAQLVVEQSPVPLKHVNVGELVKERGLHAGFDEEWQSYIVDEDKVKWTWFGLAGSTEREWRFLMRSSL